MDAKRSICDGGGAMLKYKQTRKGEKQGRSQEQIDKRHGASDT